MYLMQTILRGLGFASNTESVTTLKRATRNLIIEKYGGSPLRKTRRKRRIVKSKENDGGVGVIGMCSDSPIVQEALCPNTKDD